LEPVANHGIKINEKFRALCWYLFYWTWSNAEVGDIAGFAAAVRRRRLRHHAVMASMNSFSDAEVMKSFNLAAPASLEGSTRNG
jgi:hypothetical protein